MSKKTPEQPYYLTREDGRVERVCKHGVGHPIRHRTEASGTRWEQWMGVHGCDGCCSQWKDDQ